MMQDLNDKITGGNLSAAEWNEVPSELQNVITSQGISLSSGDLNQLGKAIAGHLANGTFYTDSGAANTYVLTKVGNRQAAPAYTDGFEINFIANSSNTGASTVNVDGLGAKDLRTSIGDVLPAGVLFTIVEGLDNVFRFNSVSDVFRQKSPRTTIAAAADKKQWPKVSNDSGDIDHDILFSAGTILDSIGAKVISLDADKIKRLDAPWAIGSGSGGLFSGTIAANTTYHMFVIMRDSDGFVDAGFDTDVSAANIPAGYTAFRRIGSMFTDNSANIERFIQNSDRFRLQTPLTHFIAGTPGSTAQTLTAKIPTGLELIANITAWISASVKFEVLISSLDQADQTPQLAGFITLSTDVGGSNSSVVMDIKTNTSAEYRSRGSGPEVLPFYGHMTRGWIDDRTA